MSHPKIFLGMVDIASQISDLKKGFSQKGIQAYAVVEEDNTNLHHNVVDRILCTNDKILKKIRPYKLQRFIRFYFKKRSLLKIAIKEYDVFIFFWNSIMDDASDLEVLKKNGKKIVVFFVGSDERYMNAYDQEMRNYNIPSYFTRMNKYYETKYEYLESKLRYIRNVEKYADIIYSLPNQSQLALRPYNHFFVPIDLELIIENNQQREVPVIVHAPSHRGVKGTDIILKTLNTLKSEGLNFDLKLVENMPYVQALREFTNADIVIGELYIPSAGKLDREALAAGCVVLSSMCYEYIDNPPAECPIIDVNPDNLYAKLRDVVLNYNFRCELAKKGRSFVKKYHSLDVVCDKIIERITTESDVVPDFIPEFFNKEFIPENKKYANLYNKFNKHVSSCDWYEKNIVKGSRDNLIF